MDQVTQQNAGLMEEAAAAADSMQVQAQQLARIVGTFRLPKDLQDVARGRVALPR